MQVEIIKEKRVAVIWYNVYWLSQVWPVGKIVDLGSWRFPVRSSHLKTRKRPRKVFAKGSIQNSRKQPCFNRSCEGLTLETSASKLFMVVIYVINSADKTKLPCYTLPPSQHHSFLRTSPLIRVCSFPGLEPRLRLNRDNDLMFVIPILTSTNLWKVNIFWMSLISWFPRIRTNFDGANTFWAKRYEITCQERRTWTDFIHWRVKQWFYLSFNDLGVDLL